MSTHSLLGASSLDRRLACPGSFVLEEGRVSKPSRYASEGTVAHNLAALCFEHGYSSPVRWLGEEFVQDGFKFTVDTEMVEAVELYVKHILNLSKGHRLLVEQKLDIGWLVDIEGDTSTADAIIFAADDSWLYVGDLKYGKGKRVDIEKTVQPTTYALAALREYDLLLDHDALQKVIVEIVQPRIEDGITRHVFTVEELRAEEVRIKAGCALCHEARASELPQQEWNDLYLRPSDAGCQFCKAINDCPKRAQQVEEALDMTFGEIAELPGDAKKEIERRARDVSDEVLGARLAVIDLIEDFCAATRDEAYERMLRDDTDIGDFYLGVGKQGNRAWANPDEAEEVLKKMRLKAEQMYDFKLISPTKAEKVLKESPRKWAKVEALITRSPGGPVLCRKGSKSPRWHTMQVQFEEVPETSTPDASNNEDLF